jgi:hypothetical protein
MASLLRSTSGWVVNDKRVERIWRQEGLKVPPLQPKRSRIWPSDGSLQYASATRITGLSAPSPGGLHSAVRAGGCATPTGFAARAGAQTNHALTFNPDHSLGVGHVLDEKL